MTVSDNYFYFHFFFNYDEYMQSDLLSSNKSFVCVVIRRVMVFPLICDCA